MFKFSKITISPIVKNVFIYASGAFFLKGVSIFIVPIIMRILTPADYGLLSLATNFINILLIFVGLGLRELLLIDYFHFDAIGKKKIVNDIITIYFFVTLPVFMLLFWGAELINTFFFINQAVPSIIYFCLFLVFITFFVELFFQVLQYQGIAFRLTLIKTFSSLLLVCFNLIFLYVFDWGVFGFIAAQVTSVLIAFVVAIFFYFNQLYHIHLQILCSLKKSMWYMKRSILFIPKLLFSWILTVGDRWVLAKYATLHDVGIYSVADMFGECFRFAVILPISYAYVPYLLNKFASNKKNIVAVEYWNQKNMLIVMFLSFFVVSVCYVVCKPVVFIIFPQKYHAAYRYVFVLLIGYIFFLGTYFASGFLHFKKKVYPIVFSLFLPMVVNIILNIILVPKYNIWGCVIATVIAYIIYFFIVLGCNFYAIKQYFY